MGGLGATRVEGGGGGVRRPLFEREAPDQFETESLKTGPSLSRRYWLQPYYCPSVVVCLKWERGGVGLLRGGRKTRRDFCLWLSKKSWEQTGWIFLMDGQRRLFLSGQSASAAESRRPSISLSIKAGCRDWRMSARRIEGCTRELRPRERSGKVRTSVRLEKERGHMWRGGIL